MDFSLWLKGIAATFIGGAVNAISVVVIDPVAFNFGQQWKKTLAAAVFGGLLSVSAYLKKSPFVESEVRIEK